MKVNYHVLARDNVLIKTHLLLNHVAGFWIPFTQSRTKHSIQGDNEKEGLIIFSYIDYQTNTVTLKRELLYYN
jgi:hypothetical protein